MFLFFPVSAFFPVLTYDSLCLSAHVSLPLHLICVTPHFSYLCTHFLTGKQLTLHPVLPESLSLVCINLAVCRFGNIRNIVNHFLLLITVLKRHHLLRVSLGCAYVSSFSQIQVVCTTGTLQFAGISRTDPLWLNTIVIIICSVVDEACILYHFLRMNSNKEEGDSRKGRVVFELFSNHRPNKMISAAALYSQISVSWQGELCPCEGGRSPAGRRQRGRPPWGEFAHSSLSCEGRQQSVRHTTQTTSRHGWTAQTRRYYQAGEASWLHACCR